MSNSHTLASVWGERVRQHHAQSEAARDQMGKAKEEDFWKPIANKFRADPRRTDDSLVNRLLREVQPDSTVLDVGGGAGRLALPLALKCEHVTVAEPSDSMLEQLRIAAGEANIRNVKAHAASWENARVDPADFVLCAHVLYGVEDIETFVRKLDAHAKKSVLIVMFLDAPQSHHSHFWKAVHGEERITLPALKELMPILWELGFYPDLEMLERMSAPVYDDLDEALHDLRFRLYVAPSSDKDKRLRQAIDELLVSTDGGLTFKDATSRQLALASWRK
ncbi:MAG: class I SAM-dependent methyltransferase [Chloroflexi bacterium]|nr:class I SAM-dependent methyltransferase [Chloroflexota bacterium]